MFAQDGAAHKSSPDISVFSSTAVCFCKVLGCESVQGTCGLQDALESVFPVAALLLQDSS